jgi:hypothetical protein
VITLGASTAPSARARRKASSRQGRGQRPRDASLLTVLAARASRCARSTRSASDPPTTRRRARRLAGAGGCIARASTTLLDDRPTSTVDPPRRILDSERRPGLRLDCDRLRGLSREQNFMRAAEQDSRGWPRRWSVSAVVMRSGSVDTSASSARRRRPADRSQHQAPQRRQSSAPEPTGGGEGCAFCGGKVVVFNVPAWPILRLPSIRVGSGAGTLTAVLHRSRAAARRTALVRVGLRWQVLLVTPGDANAPLASTSPVPPPGIVPP